ncbi:MAG: type II toxin-antitoxin system HicB family antitoxin [Acidobacteriota bacterium]|nr:type II toxin-antitoxin system HicB family antitoxin [Acidobacteriota bacterium]
MQTVTMTTKTLDEYLKEPYGRLLIQDDDGTFAAEIVEFSGCFSQGETADEAMKNLDEAARNWIEETIRLGKPIPAPIANYEFGGKFALRLPRSLHRKAALMAERDGVSLNTFLVDAIATRVGAHDFYNQLFERLEKRLIQRTAANVVARLIPGFKQIEARSVWDYEPVSASPIFNLNQTITIEGAK